MRFGCVTSEIGRIQTLGDMGYDYVELRCRALAPLDDDLTFAGVRDRILQATVQVEALSGFIPPYVGLKVVGPDVDRARLRRYTETMLDRGAQVRARVVVFGSGAARTAPDGYPRPRALDQLRDYLTLAADLAAPRGITIALEPLTPGETNLVNDIAEALEVVRSVGRPALRPMIDYYYVLTDGRPLAPVEAAGRLLAHVHTSDADRRTPAGAANQVDLLAALRRAVYDGRLSVEARFEDFERDAPAALAYLRSVWAQFSGSQPT
jgi:sugar phosphate isomerase/epimerase